MDPTPKQIEVAQSRIDMTQSLCERFGMTIRGRTIKIGEQTAKLSLRPLVGNCEQPVVMDMHLLGLSAEKVEAILAVLRQK